MSATGVHWFKYSSPQAYHLLARRMIPWFAAAAVGLIAVGLYVGFLVAPTDVTQGASVSITAVPTMAGTMVTAMLVMMFGFWMYSIAVMLARMGGEVLAVWRRHAAALASHDES
jgi:heme exporter protein C